MLGFEAAQLYHLLVALLSASNLTSGYLSYHIWKLGVITVLTVKHVVGI